MFIHLFSPYRVSIDRRAKGATYGVAALSHTGARGGIGCRAKGATYGVVAVSHTGARGGVDRRAKGATYGWWRYRTPAHGAVSIVAPKARPTGR